MFVNKALKAMELKQTKAIKRKKPKMNANELK